MPEKKGSWIVTVECTVRKSVVCENCTEKEATADPFEYAIDEREIEMIDWELEKVEVKITNGNKRIF